MEPHEMPVNKQMCATCPWREGSPVENLRTTLSMSALQEANRVCHCTGGPNLVHPEGTGKPERVCRGARNLQLAFFAGVGLLKEPTDEAWYAMVAQLKAAGAWQKKGKRGQVQETDE